ncbi:MAG: 2-oxoacid:acceptor oxidoreductase family protein [Patescibacteria group bacterium]|nr:2-oxoacid:acceptor oxidoreductase family protein [Patescibacteria group bacterium]
MKKIMTKEIRIHGRGGQGVVAMAEILAIAFFNDGKIAQAFPHFGVERSGAPIQSFVRVSEKEILTRQHIYNPDILIILDSSLIGRADIFSGIKKDSQIVINSPLKPAEIFFQIKNNAKLPVGFKVSNILAGDASKIALEVFGKNMVNTTMLGFLSKIPGLLNVEGGIKAVKEKFSDKGQEIIDKNILAIKKSIIN